MKYQAKSTSNLNSLSSVLVALANQTKVTIVTHSLQGPWKRDWSQASKDRETAFLDKLNKEVSVL